MRPRRAQWIWSVVGFAGLSCGEVERSFVAWPQLSEQELAFVFELSDGRLQAILGPYASGGPEPRLELEGRAEVQLLILDKQSLSALHPRVHMERWTELRLGERPTECLACDGVCRGASNELLFRSLEGLGRSMVEEDGAFSERPGSQWTSLWLHLPARWDCEDVDAIAPFEEVARWDDGSIHSLLSAVETGELLALTRRLRWVGPGPDRVLPEDPGAFYYTATSAAPGRVFVSLGYHEEARGAVLEVAMEPDRFEILRAIPFPFHVVSVFFDERGLVALGTRGDIATSTDTFHFKASRIAQNPSVIVMERLGTQEAPFLLGARSGAVFRGDPWQPTQPWSTDRVDLVVDSGVSQLFRSELGASSLLWARTHERGLFHQQDGEPWQPLELEMPARHPRCRLRTNGCGFGEPPARARQGAARGETVFLTAQNCPMLLALHPPRACTSSLELLDEGVLRDDPAAVAVAGEHVYILFPDRVLRAPVSIFE